MRQIIPSADCPYNYLEPVTNPAMFFGREGQLKSIQEGVSGQMRSSFLVVGGPRMGKTSLMLELRRRLDCGPTKKVGLLPIYLDLARIRPGSYPSVVRTLNRRLREAIASNVVASVSGSGHLLEPAGPDRDETELLEEALSLLWQQGIRVVFLFDADAAFPGAGWQSLCPYLCSLYESALGQAVAYVIAIECRSELRQIPEGLDFLNLLYTVELCNLTEEDTFTLVNSPTANRCTDVAQEVYVQSGGHPFLAQYLMVCVWEQGFPKTTPVDIRRFAKEFGEEREDFLIWCNTLGEVGRNVYRLVAREGRISYSEIQHQMLQTGDTTSGHTWGQVVAVRDAVQQLRTMGLVQYTAIDTYSLGGVMFYNFFRLHDSSMVLTTAIGGTPMTIEQDALQVAEFLRSLREQIIAHPAFGRIYGDVRHVDQEVIRLASALATNYQRLQEARHNLALYPGRRQYQDDVDIHLQGLSTTTLEIEKLWRQFRADAQTGTESLIIQVEQKAPKQSPFDSILAGLGKFKDFLVVALEIKKAVTEWSPVLVDTIRGALDQLGEVSLPW